MGAAGAWLGIPEKLRKDAEWMELPTVLSFYQKRDKDGDISLGRCKKERRKVEVGNNGIDSSITPSPTASTAMPIPPTSILSSEKHREPPA